MSYKDQRELDGLPQKIEELEVEQEEIQTQVSNPEFYKQEQTVVDETLKRLAAIEKELESSYERWEELGG